MRPPRPRPLLLAASVVLLALPPAAATDPADRARKPTAAASAEEAAVGAVIDSFFAAAREKDWDTAAALMSDDFEIFTDGAAGFGKEEYHRLLKEDDLEVHQMELRDLELRVSPDGTMAWASYRGTFRGTSAGAAHDVDTAETLIFAKEAGRWRIVRAHASVKPVDGVRASR